ncbi:MAG TPA: FAD-dependent oxidoreductase [Gemmatimonadaceae bacterium]|nr:FAD-dependent oxidoreductase [Gemmatimonadaceae bacterium]
MNETTRFSSPIPTTSSSYGAIVIGGGFYGARLALMLRRRGLRVLLVEREASLLSRASARNQARVHNGYHYPRSILTSLRSRLNYRRFLNEYSDCVHRSFTHYYAVARGMSKVTAGQFVEFCRRIEAPLAAAPSRVAKLFDGSRIEAVFEVEECAFDAAALRVRMARELQNAGVEVSLSTEAVAVATTPSGLVVGLNTLAAPPVFRSAAPPVHAALALNCTYSRLNHVLNASKAEPIPAKHELTELALVEPPDALDGAAVTVMDGPFFSLMPYPSRGLHTLSHVRYTPHFSWNDKPDSPVVELRTLAGSSRFDHMMRDAARYLPAMRTTRYADSIWEIKTVMPRSEKDDSRPILLRRCAEHPALITVLGAKIDSVYDVEDALLAELDQRPARRVPRPTPTDVRRLPDFDRRPAGRR